MFEQKANFRYARIAFKDRISENCTCWTKAPQYARQGLGANTVC